MYRYPIFLLVAALFPACNHSGSQQDYAASEKTMTMEMPRTGEAPTPPGDQSAAPQPKIILTASMRCRVKDLERSTQSVRQAVEGMKGSITQMNWVHSQSSIENMLTIRIPSDKLDTLLERISREATYVHYRNLHSEDVTAEYVDIETRLRTKKEVRDRYIDILRNKARTVTEVLDAEEKIRVLQEEIEAQEGRLKYLSNQVALSTLTLELYQPVTRQTEPESVEYPFGKRVADNLASGWKLLQSLTLGILYLWPLWLAGAVGVVVWRRRKVFRR
ncbi:MAG: DUF4349 domain-containing protein [Haliscomenobacter sp.]|nr:DUF4349 domain-containing protein [Haliscomenobacter sp.]